MARCTSRRGLIKRLRFRGTQVGIHDDLQWCQCRRRQRQEYGHWQDVGQAFSQVAGASELNLHLLSSTVVPNWTVCTLGQRLSCCASASAAPNCARELGSYEKMSANHLVASPSSHGASVPHLRILSALPCLSASLEPMVGGGLATCPAALRTNDTCNFNFS